MLVAIVRRDNNRVRSFTEGSAAACKRRECDKFYTFPVFPTNIDRTKCWEVVDGQLVEYEPDVTARHVEEARYREFRKVTDPMTTGGRQLTPEWADYVQRLRDMTKRPDGKSDRSREGMLSRWPKRPDGTDAVEHLRGKR